jgi:hypothetical protein
MPIPDLNSPDPGVSAPWRFSYLGLKLDSELAQAMLTARAREGTIGS